MWFLKIHFLFVASNIDKKIKPTQAWHDKLMIQILKIKWNSDRRMKIVDGTD